MDHRHVPGMQSPNYKLEKLDMLSQHAVCKQAIQACNWPIRNQGIQTCYPSMQ